MLSYTFLRGTRKEDIMVPMFDNMKEHGTRIIIYNLWEDDGGKLELDFDADSHDIQIRGVKRDGKNIEMEKQYPNARHFFTYRHSLRVAGLTNNSYTSESLAVRHCVQKYKVLGDYVLQVAKKSLDDMLYVGLTEEHRESATMFANVVGSKLISQLKGSNSSTGSTNDKKSELSSSFSDSKHNNNDHKHQESLKFGDQ